MSIYIVILVKLLILRVHLKVILFLHVLVVIVIHLIRKRHLVINIRVKLFLRLLQLVVILYIFVLYVDILIKIRLLKNYLVKNLFNLQFPQLKKLIMRLERQLKVLMELKLSMVVKQMVILLVR